MAEELVGQLFGSYRLERLIGQGGFADVYLGQHLRLSMQAAIKILHARISEDDSMSFHHEAETIAALVHPHIIRVLDYDVKNTLPFLVLEYAPNGSLRQRHPKGTYVPLPLVVQYVAQVSDALQYAHEQRLIHRDVKPENMLVGRRNEILLTDFGIATMVQNTSSVNVDAIAGSLPYVAPEQLQRHPHFASDQYSLGIVVYEWLCGERPFHGSFTEIAVKHMTIPPPSMREKVPTIPLEVEQVVMTALAKDPRQRFGNVRAFSKALEQAATNTSIVTNGMALTGPTAPMLDAVRNPIVLSAQTAQPGMPFQATSPITPPQAMYQTPPLIQTPYQTPQQEIVATPPIPPSPIPHAAKTEPRPTKRTGAISRRAVLFSVGAVVVVGAGGSAAAWWALAPHLPYVYRGHKDQVWSLAWSPDGSQIVSGGGNAAKTDADNSAQVWNPLNGARSSTFALHKDGVGSLAWSPDSKRIVSGSFENVFIWDATNGAMLAHQEDKAGNPLSNVAVSWSPDGKTIITGRENGVVQIRSLDAQPHAQFQLHKRNVNALAWSPDSKRVATASSDGTVLVWTPTDGRIIFTLKHAGPVNAVAWSPDGQQIASGDNANIVSLWNANDGSLLHQYTAHTRAVNAVAWSPDSKLIASGSADTTARVWNVTDRTLAAFYQGHANTVTAIAWLPTWSIYGQILATSSLDGTVQVWKI